MSEIKPHTKLIRATDHRTIALINDINGDDVVCREPHGPPRQWSEKKGDLEEFIEDGKVYVEDS